MLTYYCPGVHPPQLVAIPAMHGCPPMKRSSVKLQFPKLHTLSSHAGLCPLRNARLVTVDARSGFLLCHLHIHKFTSKRKSHFRLVLMYCRIADGTSLPVKMRRDSSTCHLPPNLFTAKRKCRQSQQPNSCLFSLYLPQSLFSHRLHVNLVERLFDACRMWPTTLTRPISNTESDEHLHKLKDHCHDSEVRCYEPEGRYHSPSAPSVCLRRMDNSFWTNQLYRTLTIEDVRS